MEPKFECKLQGSLVYVGKICLSTELWLDFGLVLYFTSLALAKSDHQEEETRKMEMQCIAMQVQAVKTTTAVRFCAWKPNIVEHGLCRYHQAVPPPLPLGLHGPRPLVV